MKIVLAILTLLFTFLGVLVPAANSQVLQTTGVDNGIIPGTPVKATMVVTGSVVKSGTSVNWGFVFPVVVATADTSRSPATNYYKFTGGSGTVSGFGAFSFSGGSVTGPTTVSISSATTAGLTAYLNANDCTITVNALVYANGGTGFSSSVTSGSFVWSWSHSTTTVTPVTLLPAVVQREITMSYTNNLGVPSLIGMGMYTGTPASGTFTGGILDPQYLAVGGTYTWNVAIDPLDPYLYSPTVVSSTSQITGFGHNVDGVIEYSAVPFGAITSQNADSYSDGSTLMALPTFGTGATTTALDGSVTSGSAVMVGGGASNAAGGQVILPNGNTPITAVTGSAQGGGTSGGGGGGASDAGLVNNAQIINQGINVAESQLAATVASGANAITSQLAKGQANEIGALQALALSGGGGGGSGTDNSGIESRLDTLHADNTQTQSQLQSATAATAANAGFAATPSAGSQGSAGSAAGAADQGNLGLGRFGGGSALGTIPSGPTETDASTALKVQFPMAFGGATIDLNPFESGRLAGIAGAFRAALTWLIVAVFTLKCTKDMRQWIYETGKIRQAQGNAIAGGTGAQSTAFIAAAAITVIIAAAVVVISGLVSGDIAGFGVNLGSSSPMAGFTSNALWMVDQCYPVATTVTALLVYPAFVATMASVHAGITAAIRYIVP